MSYKLFVGNVPFNCSLDEFNNVFKDQPGFIKAELIYRVKSKLTRGFGFIEVESKDNIKNLLENTFNIGNRTLRITEYTSDNTEKKDVYKIFIKNLEYLTENEIINGLKKYNSVISVSISTDKDTNKSRGHGIIELGSNEEYMEIIGENTLKIKDVVTNVYPFKNKFQKNKVNFINKKKPYDDKSDEYNGKSYKADKMDNKSTYRQGFNSGHAAGYSVGYYTGYIKGYDDCKNGLQKDPKKNYLKVAGNAIIIDEMY